MKLFYYLSILIVFFSLSACTSGTRHITLDYQALKKPYKNKEVSVYIQKFKDEREDKTYIGKAKNFITPHLASVETKTNISSWMTEALKAELKQAGFTISKDPTTPFQVSGKILKVFSEASLNFEGEIEAYIAVKINQKVVLDKVYYFTAKELNIRGAPEYFKKNLEDSLRGLLGQIVQDVDSKI